MDTKYANGVIKEKSKWGNKREKSRKGKPVSWQLYILSSDLLVQEVKFESKSRGY